MHQNHNNSFIFGTKIQIDNFVNFSKNSFSDIKWVFLTVYYLLNQWCFGDHRIYKRGFLGLEVQCRTRRGQKCHRGLPWHRPLGVPMAPKVGIFRSVKKRIWCEFDYESRQHLRQLDTVFQLLLRLRMDPEQQLQST